MASRRVVGCMTGTSMDAIDVALVTVDGHGLRMRASVQRCATHPLGPLAGPLRRLAFLEPASARHIAALARDLALCHVAALGKLVRDEPIDLIAVHGQTIFHAPPVSWQLLAPAPIAEAFRVPVVFDLRAADLAAGGQGAPITPLADFVLFRDDAETRAIVNLGGFANYTILPGRPMPACGAYDEVIRGVHGGDVCACNQLLDAIARDLLGEPFDERGRRAAAGAVRPVLRDTLVELLRGQAGSGRSLGTGDELGEWIEHHRGGYCVEDIARSACCALAIVITDTISEAVAKHYLDPVKRVLLSGGGVENAALYAAFKEHGRAQVQRIDQLGVPSSHREAAAMAVLGALCQDGVPVTLPQITNVRSPAPIAGAWIHPARV
ncbi:MAG: anhydro-N-acetylmuramic acid kinase [Phycisphaerales bacterium]|nr:MAG: anhydro-N-acetylmuramic acid kinase [Phycisphaerales bacterium]